MYDEDKLTATRKENSDQQPGLYFSNCSYDGRMGSSRWGAGHWYADFDFTFDFNSTKGLDNKEHMLSHILERLIECSHYHNS